MALGYKKLVRYLDKGLDPYSYYTALEIRKAVGDSLVAFFRKLHDA